MRRFAHFVVTHARAITAANVIIVVAAAWFAAHIRFDFNMENMLPDRHPSRAVYDDFQSRFGEDDATYVLALTDTDIFTAKTLRAVDRLSRQLQAHPAVEEVTSLTTFMYPRADGDAIDVRPFVESVPDDPAALSALRAEAFSNPFLPENLISTDARTTAIAVRLRPTHNHHEIRVEFENWFRERLSDYASEGRSFHLGGTPVLRSAYIYFAKLNVIIFTPISIVVLITVLALTFRSAMGVVLPLAVVLSSTILSVGLMTIADVPINLLTNALPTIILVVGVSDSIHLIVKYKEEYHRNRDQRQALAITVRKMASACFYTSITTAVGFGSLFTSSNKVIRQFGVMAAAGVMMAYVVTITLLPAVLSLLKPLKERQHRSLHEGRLADSLGRLTEFLIRRPRSVLAGGLVTTFLFAVGIAFIQQEYFFMQDLNETTDVQRAYRYLDEHLGSAVPFEVEITSRGGRPVTDPAVLRQIDRIAERLRAVPEVGKVLSTADFVKEMNRLVEGGDAAAFRIPETREAVAQELLLYSLGSTDPTASYMTVDAAHARISARTPDMGQRKFHEITALMESFVAREIDPDLQVIFTGAGPMIVVLVDRLVADMVSSLLSAFLIIAAIMYLEFRSVSLALLSMIPNVMPLALIAGIMGFAGIALSPATAVTFCVALGIAVDDTIHFLVRFRREYETDHAWGDAVRRTMRGTGRAMVFTSVVLALGFMVLATSSFTANRHFGMLSALLMVAALFADLLVTPALLLVTKPRLGAYHSDLDG